MPRINRLRRRKDDGGNKLTPQQEAWLVYGSTLNSTNPFPTKSAHDRTWREHRAELEVKYKCPGFRCHAFFICDLKLDVPPGIDSVHQLAVLIKHKALPP